MTLKLHCFGESGHSYKAALGLTLAGLEWEAVAIDFFKGETRGETYRGINVMGEAPVLETHATRLTQSGVILQWITDQTGLLGGAPTDRYDVMRWVLWDNHKMSSMAGQVRFMMNFLPEEKRNADVIGFLSGRFRGALQVLEAHLEGRDWIVGDGVTHADISCCSYLYYPEAFTFDRAEWPRIDAWLSRISELEGWAHAYDLMPRAFAPKA